jgi:Zinc carboxypeptidase
MKQFNTLLFLWLFHCSFAQELYKSNQSLTYDQLHAEYEKLEDLYPTKCKLIQFGKSDFGKNIELLVINNAGEFQSAEFGKKSRLLINNAIHPGEPCGVDASLKLAKDLLTSKSGIPENVVIGIIPMYNVGGGHNRSCCSRANQNGPEEYGFRGNSKNLDLNRDFIKADARNTIVFYKIYHFLKPNVFVDTHTSNGADYQHIMTLITSQKDKMHPLIQDYTTQKLSPFMFEKMERAGYEMVPYVHQIKKTPEGGIKDYLETPRYSTGYTNLFNTIGFVTETHMLKTFEQRVESTYSFLDILIQYMDDNSEHLVQLKQKADYNTGLMEYIPIRWELDTTEFEMIDFKGYAAEYKKSEVTNLDRLFYNHAKPWTDKIRYYNSFKVTDSVKRPAYYIIPQAWYDVLVRLQLNGVKMQCLLADKEIECEVYYIDTYQTNDRPYEGHYAHQAVKVTKKERKMTFHKGDYLVHTTNENAQFIVQTLEPQAPDSYFSWNFFDPILQQKEWFSAYVYEETAKKILLENEGLRNEFLEKQKTNKEFASNSWAQLYFIYQNSGNYERTFNQYPICRFMGEFKSDEMEEGSPLLGF